MNAKHLVTVIVPVYNVEQYLRKCIESIMSQSYTNLEIILVDDGATDSSGSICDEYKDKDKRIKVIHKNNGGLSSARNAGLQVATGDYISYVDSDDYIQKNFIEELINLCLLSDKGFACINFQEFIVEEKEDVRRENDVQPQLFDEISFIKEIVDRDRKSNITYCVWSKLFRKDIIKDMEFPEGKTYEDILYTTKAAINAKGCIYKNVKLYNYRIREGSISKSHYKEGFDTRLLTDRLSIQVEQLEYIDKNISSRLSNIIKFEYYDEMLNILKCNNSPVWEKEIQNALNEFRLTIPEIFKLPYPIKRKVAGIIKMTFPNVINAKQRNKCTNMGR